MFLSLELALITPLATLLATAAANLAIPGAGCDGAAAFAAFCEADEIRLSVRISEAEKLRLVVQAFLLVSFLHRRPLI